MEEMSTHRGPRCRHLFFFRQTLHDLPTVVLQYRLTGKDHRPTGSIRFLLASAPPAINSRPGQESPLRGGQNGVSCGRTPGFAAFPQGRPRPKATPRGRIERRMMRNRPLRRRISSPPRFAPIVPMCGPAFAFLLLLPSPPRGSTDMATDPRFLAASGREVFTGNELLVKGALEVEGGVHLLTGYPGSPVAAFFDVLGDVRDLLKQNGVRAFQANNEALGAAAANGSQMAACRAIVTMKSVGVHVASDALAIGNLAGPNPEGGVVVVSGDDPWCDSTQVPADSRFLYEHLRIAGRRAGHVAGAEGLDRPVASSSAPASGLYVGYIVTTAHADGGGTVALQAQPVPADQHQAEDRPGHASRSTWARSCSRRAPGRRSWRCRAGTPKAVGAGARTGAQPDHCRRRRRQTRRELGHQLGDCRSRRPDRPPSASSSPAWAGRTCSTC